MANGRIPAQLVFGLDIGTRSVVGTVGYKQHAGDFTVVAQATRFHETRAMMDGQIHDIGRVAETVAEVRRELEEKLGRKLNDVCIAAAGRVLKTFTVRTDYELGEDTLITPEFIRSMELIGVEQAHDGLRKAEGDKSGYFSVGYSVVRYYLNDVQITNLEGHKASRIGADIIATFLPQDVIDGLYAATERAGLNVVNLTLEPIAAINLAIPEKFRLLNLALVDVGAGTSDICITKDGSVTAYGMIPCAGDHLTEAVMKECLVEFNVADEIKIQLSSHKKKIIYKDIMGLKQTVSSDSLKGVLDKPMDELATRIAAKIVELNGGKGVSAIFVVGGGGKHPNFTKLLAAKSKLGNDRVALRGEEVLTQITFLDESIVKDPMLVTPIGICLNYYEQNNNFIFVKVNDELVKLYDNGHLTILDAALAIGLSGDALFPARGDSLDFTINGERRLIRGETGEAAVILINGKPASIASAIVQNDSVTITPSTAGAAAHATIGELPETRRDIRFIVNGKRVSCPRLVVNKGRTVSVTGDIHTGDELTVLDHYTVDKLTEYMDVRREGTVMVNNVIALGDEKLYENFTIDFGLDAGEHGLDNQDEIGQDKSVEGLSVAVTVNGKAVIMSGKREYRLVDVLDFYPFDTNTPHGEEVVMKVNGETANFTTTVRDGDAIELFWR